jgi:hypothetical protein
MEGAELIDFALPKLYVLKHFCSIKSSSLGLRPFRTWFSWGIHFRRALPYAIDSRPFRAESPKSLA